MIVSVSRRTDIPALYAEWFLARLEAGSAAVVNPYNAKQVRVVSLRAEDVDAFVFWSKNPDPLFERADRLAEYPWLLQYTLNAYPRRIEPGIPAVEDRLEGFARLARRYGANRMNWRYDPILFAEGLGSADHERAFRQMARRLEGHTSTCTISFIDEYAGLDKRMAGLGLRKIEEAQMRELAGRLARIGAEHGIALSACAEPYDFTPEGVLPGRCVDKDRLSAIAGKTIAAKKDKNQRPGCGCAASVDIGRYGTCVNGCLYCYAVKGKQRRRAVADGDRL